MVNGAKGQSKKIPSGFILPSAVSFRQLVQSGSAFLIEPLQVFVFAQFRTENRYALFLELL
ncbi:MAG: hypothetical protein EOR85_27225 [Mesorhizobium sp.]|nr:MAG: hypothetical protein EOR79_12360 [Mesorhizobium sp.]RWM93343.1 MAG: hypothetical protein EOR85_27225 [Mesorhizobium sp.]TIR42099.1 MAG: hypothetical protein E5X64_06635 [Mesorhizobium sp.]